MTSPASPSIPSGRVGGAPSFSGWGSPIVRAWGFVRGILESLFPSDPCPLQQALGDIAHVSPSVLAHVANMRERRNRVRSKEG